LVKSDISLVVFSPGSAETNAGWGEKRNDRSMAHLRNFNKQHLILAKFYVNNQWHI